MNLDCSFKTMDRLSNEQGRLHVDLNGTVTVEKADARKHPVTGQFESRTGQGNHTVTTTFSDGRREATSHSREKAVQKFADQQGVAGVKHVAVHDSAGKQVKEWSTS